MRDEELRRQFTDWARPLRAAAPPAVPVLRRRARWRAAPPAPPRRPPAAAVAGIALVSLPRTGPGVLVAAPASPPRFAVVLQHASGSQPARVTDMTTGKTAGLVRPPVTASSFEWAAATPGGRTFVLADQSQTRIYRFYRLHLTAGGRTGPLRLLRVAPLHFAQIYGMALTADGSKLALAWQNDPNAPQRSRIQVTTLATGATRTWTSARGSADTVSWAGTRTLAFDWQDAARPARSGIRLLNTAAPGTSPLGSRLLIPGTTRAGRLRLPASPLITTTGVLATLATGPGGAATVIAEFSARTGHLLRTLTPPATVTGSQAVWYCGILYADPAGRHLITQCGNAQGQVTNGKYTPIHLRTHLPAANIGYANSFAW